MVMRCDAGQVTGTDPKPLVGLTEEQRDKAMARWQVLRPHIEDGVPLVRLAGHGRVAGRTLQRWAARYRADGLAGLARCERADRGARRLPQELQLLIEGLALKRPPPSIATIHRDVTAVARQHGWPVPGYATGTTSSAASTRRSPSSLMTGQNAMRSCTTWGTAGRPASRTRSGRPTTPSSTCG